MHLCPQCGVVLMEGLRFCLQCGTELPAPSVARGTEEAWPLEPQRPDEVPPPPAAMPAPTVAKYGPPVESTPASPAPQISGPIPSEAPTAYDAGFEEDFAVPHPVFSPESTLALKASPSPMIAPREGVPLERVRSKLGRDMVDLDEEVLNRSPRKPATTPDAIFCRFCKAPLALDGDFCETCGAPVADAAPPGTVEPKTPAVPFDTAPPPPGPLSPTFPATARTSAAPRTAETSAAQAAPVSAARSAESRAGFVDRLKGLLKKD